MELEPSYSLVVQYDGKIEASTLNLDTEQIIVALLQINQKLDQFGTSLGGKLQVFVIEESPVRH